MKVYVGCMTIEDPFDYRFIPGDRLCVCYDWVPYGMHAEINGTDQICQLAADGDGCARRLIEGVARRSMEHSLIRDLKRVIGPGWSRALEVLIENEDTKEAGHD